MFAWESSGGGRREPEGRRGRGCVREGRRPGGFAGWVARDGGCGGEGAIQSRWFGGRLPARAVEVLSGRFTAETPGELAIETRAVG